MKPGNLRAGRARCQIRRCGSKDEDVTSVLIGASRPEQIIQNVEIVQNTKFTREELKKIDQISRGNL